MRIILATLTALMLIGCSVERVVNTETREENDTSKVSNRSKESVHLSVNHDTLVIRDSVFVQRTGDTIWVNRYKEVYRDRFIKDSIFINVADSSKILHQSVKYVTKQVKIKEKPRFKLILILIAFCCGLLCGYKIIK